MSKRWFVLAAVTAAFFSVCSQQQQQSTSANGAAASIASNNEPSALWLARLNAYRAATGLPAVSEDTSLTKSDLKHARYLVKNFKEGQQMGGWVHHEDPSSPLYTREGDTAGQTSDVIAPFKGSIDPADALDSWLTAPFHALAMIDPELKKAGYGQYCENGVCAAVLNVGRDEKWARNAARLNLNQDPDRQLQEDPYVRTVEVAKHVLSSPVEFPPDGSTVTKNSFPGREWPDPLSACPDYSAPAGLPIVASFGTGFNPEISDYALTCNGQKREACLITPESYTSPDQAQKEVASGNLKLYAAVLLIAREPLPMGSSCTVSLTRDRTPHSWTFKVAPKG